MKDLYSIGQVAQQIRVPTYQIRYAIENLKVTGPSEKFGNLRVFTKKDVERIRKYFEGKRPGRQTDETVR